MHVQVKLFASFREAVGSRELEWELGDSASVQDLLKALIARYPALAVTLDQGLVAVNHEYVAHDAPLAHGDEVGLIPPVSGGEGL
ncbi:MAG: molybdopterin converting factor subunit 1 [Chloroflexota bacterium]